MMMSPKFHRSNARANRGRVGSFLRNNGLTVEAYRKWFGNDDGEGIMAFFKRNPRWTLRDWELLVVEHKEDILRIGLELDEKAETALLDGLNRPELIESVEVGS